MVTGTCPNDPGCISSFFFNSSTLCFTCNTQGNWNFIPDDKSKKCTCQKGFYFNSLSETCISRCGDGIKVFEEDCDDDNLISGDGCTN